MPQNSPIPKSADVRMRGFLERTSVEAAWRWVDERSAPGAVESVGLSEACERTLASPIAAPFDVPAFDRSAMDGYAVRGAETDGAGDYNRLSFAVVGEALPGRPYRGAVECGTAVRIMTGAPMPAGADAVVPAEFVHEAPGRVEIALAVAPGKNVSRRGEDVIKESVVLKRGRRLRPQDVGLIASLGYDRANVFRRPRVRIVVTGSELAVPGAPRTEHGIYDSNSYMLVALAARDGGRVESILRTGDEVEATRAALVGGDADVLIVSGASSVGAEDFVPSIVAQAGTLAVHGVAMRPSSPTGMGMIGPALVFLLPGNPVSCLCAYDFFAGRAIRRLCGRCGEFPYPRQRVVLDRKIVSEVGRVDYCRLKIASGHAEPLAVAGASVLSSTTRADGFVVIGAESEGYPPGTAVDAFLYDQCP